MVARSLDEFPSVRSVKAPNIDPLNQGRVKVVQIDSMLRMPRRIERLPMCSAPTCLAANGPERAIALDVLLRVLRVAFNLNGAELVVGPYRAKSAAD